MAQPEGFGSRFFDAWAHLDRTERRRVKGVELAKRLGVSGSSITRWAEGTVPEVDTIALIASVCGVDPGWLAFGEASAAQGPRAGQGAPAALPVDHPDRSGFVTPLGRIVRGPGAAKRRKKRSG